MPSRYPPTGGPSGDLPPELDPRRGRPARPSLPPELDPRGKRHARAQARRAPDRAVPSRLERRAEARESTDWMHGATLGVSIVAAVLSLVILLGSGWAWATYRSFTANIKRVDAISNDSAAAKKNIDGTDQNILIVGNDDRDSATDAELAALGTTRDGGSYNTDTMMLLHVPANGERATTISFPRDSYVSIPGHGMNKLNSAYPQGVADGKGNKAAGAKLLVETIEGLTGLKVDHYVQVDLLGFYRISNAIGGVTICLNQAMGPAKFVGQEGIGYDSGYEPNGKWVNSYSGINLPKGKSVIKGSQALAFVRQRHGLPGGDLDRIKRQQYFLSATFRQLSSAGVLLNPFKLQKLLSAVTSSLVMDPGLDPLKLAKQVQNLQAGNVKFTTIPTSGFANEDVGSVVVVNKQAMPAFIDGLLGTDPAADLAKAKAAAASSVTVTVINDTNSNGLEQTNAAALRALGFKTTVPAATQDVQDKTTIRYPKGSEAAAKALAAQVPGAVLERTADVKSVTLVLGNNGIQVKSLMPKSTTTAPTKPSTAASTPAASASSSSGSAVTTAADAGCIN